MEVNTMRNSLAMSSFNFHWNYYINLLVLGSDPEIEPGIIVFKTTGQELKKEIRELKQKINRAKLKNLSFIRVTSEDSDPHLNIIYEAIGVTEKRYLNVELSIHGSLVTHTFVLGKIKSNWRILFISW
jgi:hypothetical protein